MEEIEFHHTLPIQLRFNDVRQVWAYEQCCLFTFYDLGRQNTLPLCVACRLDKMEL